MKSKIYTICLDGIDKTGKDTILPYIGPLCNYKYICNVRGIMTQIAYSELYNRNYEYDLDQQKHILNVLLTVDYDDWKIRCKMNNEPEINYFDNSNVFWKAYSLLHNAGYPTLAIKTSKHSPYEIAKMIVDHINELNLGD